MLYTTAMSKHLPSDKNSTEYKERAKFFKERMKAFGNSHTVSMQQKLLTLGGAFLVPMPEPDAATKRSLTRGQVLEVSHIKMFEGVPSQCHGNSADLYLGLAPDWQLCTGYSLTLNDQLWRRHTWLYNPKTKTVLESTTKRDTYYGVTLKPWEALHFAINNTSIDVTAPEIPISDYILKQLKVATKSDFEKLIVAEQSEPSTIKVVSPEI